MNADPDSPRGRGKRGAGPGFCGGPGGGRYRRSVLEAAILSSLAEATSHGYNLVDQIDALTGDLICIDPGGMYRLLRVMEEEGLVSSSWQTPEAGPSRRVYVISERGIEALELMAASLSQRAASLQQLADRAAQAAARSRAAGLAEDAGSLPH
jgi:PadR family transcriptional regulator, regulatory protein PadR